MKGFDLSWGIFEVYYYRELASFYLYVSIPTLRKNYP